MNLRRRLLVYFLALVLCLGLLPTGILSMSAEAASRKALTAKEITKKIDKYFDAVQKSGKYYWNNNMYTGTLKTQVNNNDYTSCLTKNACPCEKKSEDHDGRSCDSNHFNGAGNAWKNEMAARRDKAGKSTPKYTGGGSQCSGFADYMLYVLFKSTSMDDFYYADKYNAVFTKSYQFQPGDMIRYNGHSVVVYEVNGSSVSVIDCNYGQACKIRIHKYNKSAKDLREGITKKYGNEKNYILIPKTNLRSTTVSPTPKITVQPKDVTVLPEETATFSVTASCPTGAKVKYQWRFRNSSAGAWVTWSGQTSPTLSVSSGSSGMQFQVIVSNDLGEEVKSSIATLTITGAPKITKHPDSISANLGNDVTFKVTASGSSLKYQWEYRDSSADDWDTLKGETKSTLTLQASGSCHGRQFRVKVTNKNGVAHSEAATLKINGAPKISTQPKGVTVKKGKKATLSVTASGKGLKYQWEYYDPAADKWKPCSEKSATTASYSFTAKANLNGRQYRVKVYSKYGTVYSKAVKLKVN